MFIVCPKCFFKRTVDAKQIPAAATMATCPRCEEKFRFRDPETGDYIENICLEFQDELSIKPQPHPKTELEIKENTQEESTSIVVVQAESLVEQEPAKASTLPEHEPIADEILGEALDKNKEIKTPEDKLSAQNISENNHQVSHDINQKDKSIEFQNIIEDTSDENPLREEEVVKPNIESDENPFFDKSLEENNSEKKHKRERFQMISDDVPWEHPERYGIFGSLFQTIARVMFRAPEFFNTIHSQSSALRPALFYALLGLFQALCLQIWLSTLEAQLLEVAPQMQESMSALSTPLAIMLSPFQAIFQLILYSAFLYLAVRITNPDRADFNLILRVVAYAYAPTILSIVPYVGPMVGLIWFVVNIVIGIRYALRLTWQKTFLALSPIFVLLVFIMSNVMSMFTL